MVMNYRDVLKVTFILIITILNSPALVSQGKLGISENGRHLVMADRKLVRGFSLPYSSTTLQPGQ